MELPQKRVRRVCEVANTVIAAEVPAACHDFSNILLFHAKLHFCRKVFLFGNWKAIPRKGSDGERRNVEGAQRGKWQELTSSSLRTQDTG